MIGQLQVIRDIIYAVPFDVDDIAGGVICSPWVSVSPDHVIYMIANGECHLLIRITTAINCDGVMFVRKLKESYSYKI